MTTSHHDESLEEAAWFLLSCAAIREQTPDKFLVATIGGQPSERHLVRSAVRAVVEALPNKKARGR